MYSLLSIRFWESVSSPIFSLTLVGLVLYIGKNVPEDTLAVSLLGRAFIDRTIEILAAVIVGLGTIISLLGPGRVRQSWVPSDPNLTEPSDKLGYCSICLTYKPPRSHHCTKCGRCNLKMDHHCIWLDQCIGYRNQIWFYFLIVCTSLALYFVAALYLQPMLVSLVRLVTHFSLDSAVRVLYYLAVGSLPILLGHMSGSLLSLHTVYILTNETLIEWFVNERAARIRQRIPKGVKIPPYSNPYDLGWRENVRQVIFGLPGHGYEWPVKPGRSPYAHYEEKELQRRYKWIYIEEPRIELPTILTCQWRSRDSDQNKIRTTKEVSAKATKGIRDPSQQIFGIRVPSDEALSETVRSPLGKSIRERKDSRGRPTSDPRTPSAERPHPDPEVSMGSSGSVQVPEEQPRKRSNKKAARKQPSSAKKKSRKSAKK